MYVVIAFATFFMYRNGLNLMSTVVNSIAPVAMGMFTAWFEKWYPAWVAAGKGKL